MPRPDDRDPADIAGHPDASDSGPARAAGAGPSRAGVGALVAVLAVLVIAGAVLAGQLLGRRDPAPGASATAAAGGASSSTPVAPTTRSSTTTTTGPSAAPGPVPTGATAFGGPIVLSAGAGASAPVLDIYEDPQCPGCARFEAVFGPAVAAIVAANEARVRVHTMTFLDAALRNDSSVRAANGGLCAADQGRFAAYVTQVYAAQPAKEGTGWTDQQLESFAVAAAVPDRAGWQACQRALTYREHLAALESNSERSGVTGTPTALLNGRPMTLDGLTAETFRTTVRAATR